MSFTKKMTALSFLGFQSIIHFFKRLCFVNKQGDKQVILDYKTDGFFPILSEWRTQYANFSHCYHCHLCDLHCPALNNSKQHCPPSYIVQSLSRSLDSKISYTIPDECHNCCECEAHCPQNVPIKKIMQTIQDYQHQKGTKKS